MGAGAALANQGNSGRRCSRAVLLALRVGLVAAAVLAPLIRTGPPAAAAGGPAPVTVRILPVGVEPSMVQVEPGATVVWVNEAGASRSVLATDASFNSGALAPGDRFQFAFTEPRTVSYSIVQTPGVSGTVIVQDPSSAPVATPFVAGAVPGTPGATPAGFAYTGSATAVNGAVGGMVLALGAALIVAARRFGIVATLSRLSFAFGPDDLLPSRRHRRTMKAQAHRGRVRR